MKKQKILKIASAIGSMLLLLLLSFAFLPSKTTANPSQLNAFTSCQTGEVASSTGPTLFTRAAFLSPGLATSTLNCNVPIASNGNVQTFDSATLLIQATASSTASDLRYWIEDSHDGIDYYPRVVATTQLATTTALSVTPQTFLVP